MKQGKAICGHVIKRANPTLGPFACMVLIIGGFIFSDRNGFQVCLVNAHHSKNVGGRESNVLDCQWIQQLHMYGLLSPPQVKRPLLTSRDCFHLALFARCTRFGYKPFPFFKHKG